MEICEQFLKWTQCSRTSSEFTTPPHCKKVWDIVGRPAVLARDNNSGRTH